MISQLEEASTVSSYKSIKLAGVEELLVPPSPEPEDSGIDSDDTNAARAAQALQSSEESSSDEEVSDKPWEYAMAGDQLLQDIKKTLDIHIQWKHNVEMVRETAFAAFEDRSSPPLYEVELTASDEDDDASVLELVIPMKSRYQRVPTSSPKIGKPKSKCFLSKLFCCVRK